MGRGRGDRHGNSQGGFALEHPVERHFCARGYRLDLEIPDHIGIFRNCSTRQRDKSCKEYYRKKPEYSGHFLNSPALTVREARRII